MATTQENTDTNAQNRTEKLTKNTISIRYKE